MSMTELLFIGLVALLILGPNELPKVAKQLGKALRDVRRASDDLRDSFEREVMSELPPKPQFPPAEAISRALLDATRARNGATTPASEANILPPAPPPTAAAPSAATPEVAEKKADPAPEAPKGTA